MTDLKRFILHQFAEMRREVLIAIEGLSEEDLLAHEPHGRSPIAWIVEHCCSNVDRFIVSAVRGAWALEHDPRFVTWPMPEPQPGDEYRPLAEMIERWQTVCDAAIDVIEGLDERALQEPGPAAGDGPRREPLVESCLRVINHQNAHLRQIWCIIGWLHIDAKYPEQRTWRAAQQ